MYKLLYISANPFEDLITDLDIEYKSILNSLARSTNASSFALSRETQVRYFDFRILSAHRPHLVHFCLPSLNDKGLFFQDLPSNNTKPKTDEAKRGNYKTNATIPSIREILLEYKVQAAVLTTPISRRDAVRLADIGVVIGFDSIVPDIVSSKFVYGFYQSLIEGKGLKKSYDTGAEGVFNSSSKSLPFLEYRPGVLPDDMFKIDFIETSAELTTHTTEVAAKKIQTDRVALRKTLQSQFDMSELKILCFDMNIDHEEVIGKDVKKSTFITAMISYCERKGRLLELKKRMGDYRDI
jgi:hypothetical protein